MFSLLSQPAFRRLQRHRLLLSVVLGAIAFVCIPVASSRAALVNTDACDNATLTQPFLPWLDAGTYKLVPGGDFEGSLSGWTLGGGAHKVSGSEPYGATGKLGSSSMELPAGATVQTPFTCVDAAYPTFRFFARDDTLLSSLEVQVVYDTPLTGKLTLPVGVVALSPSWQPTYPMLTLSEVPAALENGTARVSLRFTELSGSAQIDDIYIDPRMR